MATSTTAKQKFHISRAREATFATDGLRKFFSYRDLGIGEATQGRYHAHVIRAEQLGTEGTGRHLHRLGFQMVYILRGWVTFEYEGHGGVRLEAGDCVLQPPEIRHELTSFSRDLEMLEITSPAEFETEDAPRSAADHSSSS